MCRRCRWRCGAWASGAAWERKEYRGGAVLRKKTGAPGLVSTARTRTWGTCLERGERSERKGQDALSTAGGTPALLVGLLRFQVLGDLRESREPDAGFRFHIGNQFVERLNARAVPCDVGMHGEDEEGVLFVGGVKLPFVDLEDELGVGKRAAGIRLVVGIVVGDPVDGEFDHSSFQAV